MGKAAEILHHDMLNTNHIIWNFPEILLTEHFSTCNCRQKGYIFRVLPVLNQLQLVKPRVMNTSICGETNKIPYMQKWSFYNFSKLFNLFFAPSHIWVSHIWLLFNLQRRTNSEVLEFRVFSGVNLPSKSFWLITAWHYYLHHSHCWVNLWWQRYVNLVLVSVNPEMRVKVTIQKNLHEAQLYKKKKHFPVEKIWKIYSQENICKI